MADADSLLLAQMSVDITRVQKQMKKMGVHVDSAARRMERTWLKTNSNMSASTERFGRDARAAIAAIGVTAAVGGVQSLADAWTEAENKIAAAAVATGNAAAPLSLIADIARDTRTELSATADLYARMTRSTAALGASQTQQLSVLRTINQAFVAGGASAQEQASAILQLSQGLQAGQLNGEELVSVRTNAPLIIKAIADEMEVAEGALKKLGAEGKITTDRIFNAILGASADIEKQFAATESTIEQSFTNLRTAATQYTATLDDALGVTKDLSGFINHVADDFDLFADATLIAVSVLGARGLGGALNAAGVGALEFSRKRFSAAQQVIAATKAEQKATETAARQAAWSQKEAEAQLKIATSKREKLFDVKIKGNEDYIKSVHASAQADSKFTAARMMLREATQKGKLTVSEYSKAIRELVDVEDDATESAKQRKNISAAYDKAVFAETSAKIRLKGAEEALTVASKKATAAHKLGAVTLARLSAAGSSALNLFGGPIGLAMTAAGVAMAYFTNQSIKAARAVEKMESALSILSAQTFSTTEADNLSAAAAANLTRRREAQAKATAALAAVEKNRAQINLREGALAAADAEQRLRKEIEKTKSKLDDLLDGEDSLFGFEILEVAAGQVEILQKQLQNLETDLSLTAESSKVLNEALRVIDDIEIGGAVSGITSSGTPDVDGVKNALDEIDKAYEQAFDSERTRIDRTLKERLASIDASGAAEVDKIEAARKAREIASNEHKLLNIEAAKAADAQFQTELDMLRELTDARIDAQGLVATAEVRAYEARKAQINAEISDARLKQAALEELEAAHQIRMKELRDEALGRGVGDGLDDEIERARMAGEAKLVLARDALAQELMTREEFAAREIEIAQETADAIKKINLDARSAVLSAYSGLFGSLSQMMTTWGDDSSAAYKTLFGLSKAFAVADSMIKIQQAMAGVMGTELTFSEKIAKAGIIASQGASILSTIQGANFARGGINIRGPGTGTSDDISANISNGESVITAKGTASNTGLLGMINRGMPVEAMLSRMSMAPQVVAPPPIVPVNIYNTAPGVTTRQQSNQQGGIDVFIEKLAERVERGGDPLSQAMESRYGLNRGGR